jgi:polyferredoxin
MFDIIASMGRMRIKKKEAVIPFRQTLVYRLLLATIALVLFLFTLYELTVAIRTQNRVLLIVSGAAATMSAIAVFYNFGQVRYARIPERTLKRVHRK